MKKYKLLVTIVLLFIIITKITNYSKAVSNDTVLSEINIDPSGYELVQDESDNKIYRVKVDNSVTSIKVNAIPKNKDATITVNGNNDLSIGTNKVTVNVTAKNGEQSIYTIYVRRLSTPIAQEQLVPNVQDDYTEEQNDDTEQKIERNKETKTEEKREDTDDLSNENIVNNESINNVQTNNITNDSEKKEENYDKTIIESITNKKIIIIGAILVIVLLIVFLIIKKSIKKGKHS